MVNHPNSYVFPSMFFSTNVFFSLVYVFGKNCIYMLKDMIIENIFLKNFEIWISGTITLNKTRGGNYFETVRYKNADTLKTSLFLPSVLLRYIFKMRQLLKQKTKTKSFLFFRTFFSAVYYFALDIDFIHSLPGLTDNLFKNKKDGGLTIQYSHLYCHGKKYYSPIKEDPWSIYEYFSFDAREGNRGTQPTRILVPVDGSDNKLTGLGLWDTSVECCYKARVHSVRISGMVKEKKKKIVRNFSIDS